MNRLISAFVTAGLLFAMVTGKLHSFDDDDEDSNTLLSKKAKSTAESSSTSTTCVAGDKKCPGQKAPIKNTAQMMDDTSETIVGLFNKYTKEIMEGKYDLKTLLASDYAKKAIQMLMHGSLPGGNPTVAAGFRVFQSLSKEMARWEKDVKTKGLNLKSAMDELHDITNRVVPGLVIAVQHADRKCRRHALCRAAKAAADNSGEFPQAVALFLTNIAGSYLDITEKSKKGVYSGVIECCSTSDKGIYKKCSAKYLDDEDCSQERLLKATLLQPIDYSQLEFLKSFLPKF